MSILWTIIIGFVAGVIAKFIMPGENEPTGFILTAILGIVGAFVATYLGQALGWYGPGARGRLDRCRSWCGHSASCLWSNIRPSPSHLRFGHGRVRIPHAVEGSIPV